MLFLLAGMLVFYFFSRFPLSMPVGKVSTSRADAILLLIALLLAFYAWFHIDFTPSFGVDNVYERRMSARDTDGITGYILAPLRLLFPVLAIYAWCMRERIIWIIVCLLGALGIFSYDGTKNVILGFIILWIIMLGLKKTILQSL